MPIGTTIDGLNAVTSLTANDEVPLWDAEASGEPTKKITAQNMTASVKTLGSLVNTTEMNNALAGKQNTLTFDTTPTTGSTNPVTSGGIATAITQSIELYDNTAISSVSVSSGTFVTMATITPPAEGNYIIDTNMSFAAGSGIRILLVDTVATDANSSTNSVLSEGRATLQKIRIVRLTTNDKIYIRAYQNSGSAMSVSGSYRLLRISK